MMRRGRGDFFREIFLEIVRMDNIFRLYCGFLEWPCRGVAAERTGRQQ